MNLEQLNPETLELIKIVVSKIKQTKNKALKDFYLLPLKNLIKEEVDAR